MKQFKGPKYQQGFFGIAIAAISTVASISSAKKATKAQKSANAAQRKINELRNKQAKRAFIRNFRQAQADTLTSGVAAGVGLESSGVQATLSSEISQKRTALKEFKEFNRLGAAASTARDQASSAGFKSQVFGQTANFASQFISFDKKDT